MNAPRVAGILLLLSPSLAGCYLLSQAGGQLQVTLGSRPVPELLESPSVPGETKRKLRLVGEIKEFGIREMALSPSSSYETYYDTRNRPITWSVVACRKDRFKPWTWWFPIVGEVPYKGFFDPEDALAEKAELLERGLDVAVGGVGAYSTLGYFSDPILSTMMEESDEDLTALILHELTHGTLYVPGGADFNESLASFVGWQGAMEFARRREGVDSEAYRRTVRAFAAEERRAARARALFAELDALYRSPAKRAEKLRRREEIWEAHVARCREEAEAAEARAFDLGAAGDAPHELLEALEDARRLRRAVPAGPLNNAIVLSQRRYGGFDAFRELFERVGGDWKLFFKELKGDQAIGRAP